MSGNHIIVAFIALTLFLGTLALTLYTKLQSEKFKGMSTKWIRFRTRRTDFDHLGKCYF